MAVGEVLAIHQRDDRAIFLDVGLRHFRQENGTPEAKPLEARVRWAPAYHGAGFGDWHVPDLGSDVLCLFPVASPDGEIGDELGSGIAAFCWSNKIEPPIVQGLNGVLSSSRRVYKGRPDEAEDHHVQGDRDHQVDGNEATRVLGDETRTIVGDATHQFEADRTVQVDGAESFTVTGAEVRESKSTFDWSFRGITNFICDLAFLVKSLTTLTLHGVAKVDVISGTNISITVGSSSIVVTPTSITFTSDALNFVGPVDIQGAVDVLGDVATIGDALIGSTGQVDLGGLGGPGVARENDSVIDSPDRVSGHSLNVNAVD